MSKSDAKYKQSEKGKVTRAKYNRSEKGKATQANRYKRRRGEIIGQIFNILGAKCVTCGYSDRRALQIDHVDGSGAEERRRRNGFTLPYYLHILKHIHEGRYQVLCANCNQIKRVEDRKNKEGNRNDRANSSKI